MHLLACRELRVVALLLRIAVQCSYDAAPALCAGGFGCVLGAATGVAGRNSSQLEAVCNKQHGSSAPIFCKATTGREDWQGKAGSTLMLSATRRGNIQTGFRLPRISGGCTRGTPSIFPLAIRKILRSTTCQKPKCYNYCRCIIALTIAIDN